jgi:hypothetical protein
MEMATREGYPRPVMTAQPEKNKTSWQVRYTRCEVGSKLVALFERPSIPHDSEQLIVRERIFLIPE